MKIIALSRFSKAILLMITMVLVGISTMSNYFDNDTANWSIYAAVSLYIGAAGILVAMRFSLKDALSTSTFFIGVYVILLAVPHIENDDNQIFMAMPMLVSGIALIMMSINLWAGYLYNIARLRFLAMAAAAVAFIILAGALFNDMELISKSLSMKTMILILALSTSVVIVASDSTLGFVDLNKRNKYNMKVSETSLICVSDAYLLKEDAEKIAGFKDSESEVTTVILRSNETGKRPLSLHKIDGNIRLKIESRVYNRNFDSVLMRLSMITYDGSTVKLFGEHGQCFRIPVYDKVQPNMAMPMIFGKELDFAAIHKNRLNTQRKRFRSKKEGKT